jgi:hypothetical protein
MTKTLHGKVVGKTIELFDDPGIPDGQEVDVVVTLTQPQQRWGDGIRRSAGAAANIPEFDEIFEQVERDRQRAGFRDKSS